MLTWLHKFMKGARRRTAEARRPRYRPALEALETRTLPATSFAFAVSEADRQIYMHQLELGQTPSGTWTLTAPGQFLSVVGDVFGPTGVPVAFAIGLDHQVYRSRFDPARQTMLPWDLVAPGRFDFLVVDNYGFNGSPLLFGISTQPTAGGKVFGAKFDVNANLLSGWFSFAPGPFDTLAMARFGNSGGVELFGVNSVDHQARATRFDGLGNFIDGWVSFAPGKFQSLAAATRVGIGTLELFGTGLNGQAYAANFGTNGILINGWFPVNSPQPVNLTQIVAASLGNGNVTAFSIGVDNRVYQAVFSMGAGGKLSGWTQVSSTQVRFIAASSQDGQAKLYAVGLVDLQVYVEVFDANALVITALTPTPAGRFTQVDTAP
jgi:hypothetical protein